MSQAAFYPPQRLLQMSQDYDRTKLRLDFGTPSTSQSLPLNGAGARKRRLMPMAMASPALLQSPDLKLLKLGSPELEKIIMNNNGFIPTPTPGGSLYYTEGGSSCQEDQERLAKGFIEALQKLQERDAGPRWEVAPVDPTNERLESVDINSSSSLILPITTAGIHWKPDQNKNSVGVTTPVITNRLFAEGLIENQSSPSPPALNRHPVATQPSAAPYASYMARLNQSSTLASSFKLTHDLDRNSPKPVCMSHVSSGPVPMLSASNSPLMVDQVKSEDESNQIVPSMAGDSTLTRSLNMNPINLEAQEQIKHERKKLRNRLAAQRCRKRKIEREETLKEKVKDLKAKNAELSTLASTLRMQVCELKQTVMQHVSEGCQVFMNQELKDDIKAGNLSSVKPES